MTFFARRALRTLLILAVALAAPAGIAAQQACLTTTSAEDFTLTPTQSTSLTFPAAGASDFTATWTVVTRTYALTIDPKKKNRAWDLCIKAASASMLNGKAIQDLEWKLSSSSTWYPITTGYSQIIRATGTQSVSLDFRVRLKWTTDAPASYGALFTIAAL